MWKAIFAVAVLSTLAFGENNGVASHGGVPQAPQTPATPVAAPVDQASLLVKLNACLNQRPGTGGSLDEALKKAMAGIR